MLENTYFKYNAEESPNPFKKEAGQWTVYKELWEGNRFLSTVQAWNFRNKEDAEKFAKEEQALSDAKYNTKPDTERNTINQG